MFSLQVDSIEVTDLDEKGRSQVNPGQHANHPSYDNRVLQKLDDLITEYGPDIDPSTAFDEISELMDEIRQVIIANPNMKINDLII